MKVPEKHMIVLADMDPGKITADLEKILAVAPLSTWWMSVDDFSCIYIIFQGSIGELPSLRTRSSEYEVIDQSNALNMLRAIGVIKDDNNSFGSIVSA